MTTPLVSVVMPVFNGQDYIQEAIESILAQTLTDFELIIVDDGSTDKTGEILDRYSHSDRRVKVYHNEHHGLVFALNFGCYLAKSEYIARMDHDDIATADRLEQQIGVLLNNPQIALLGGAMETILSDGTLLGRSSAPPLENADIKAALTSYCCFAHGTVVMRKTAFANVGGYRAPFHCAQDYDLWLRMSEKYQMANLPYVLMRYRLHYNQISTSNIEQQIIETLAAQASFRLRVTTGSDPIQPQSRITRSLLNQLGVADALINDILIARYKEIISFANQMPLPLKDKDYIDKFISTALASIESGRDQPSTTADCR
jgi:glycosyltransferase involved in cell wall biosynthesis